MNPSGAWAQVTTDITADGSLGSVVNANGTVHDITGGTRPSEGPNLFHSLGQLTVGKGDTANFLNDAGLPTANILSRVTGGAPSQIFGTLQTTNFGNASLYLMNPAGVVFGPTASLNVRGSVHVTTADYLKLGQEGLFYADVAKDSVLSITSPEAFGFLNNNPDGITIDQSLLQVPDHQTLSFVSGDLTIIGNIDSEDDIAAFGGRVDLISVASAGEAVFNIENEPANVHVESFSTLGTINVSNDADIRTSGDGGGTVIIRGGRLLLDTSSIFSNTSGSNLTSLNKPLGSGIDIQVENEVVLEHISSIGHDVLQDLGQGFATPRIRVESEKLELSNFSQITSEIKIDGAGIGAEIVVDNKETLLRDGGLIRANTGGPGDSGSINIKTDNLELRDGGRIFSLAFLDASGRGGDIVIDAQSILLSNPEIGGTLTAITAQTLDTATGRAGDVQVTADSLTIEGGGNTFIQSQTLSSGDGGTINLNISGDISATGSQDNPFNVGFFANTFGAGKAGNISIFAENLFFSDHVQAGASAFRGAQGKAGNILIRTNKLELLHGSNISAAAFFGTGDGGNLDVTASDIVITGVSDSLDPFRTDFTALGVTTNEGQGGDLNVLADNIFISDKGQITSFSRGAGDSGDINIDLTGRLEVTSGGNIIASALGTGSGGEIRINTGEVHVSGVGQFNNLNDNGQSAIVSQTGLFGGDAGIINITTNLIEVLDGGAIDTNTFGPGTGGDISIVAQQGLVAGLNKGLEENLQKAGADLNSARSSISSGSSEIIPASFGPAGNVTIDTSEQFQLRDHGLLSSATTTEGKGGTITVKAGNVSFAGNGLITAASTGLGDGGSIMVTAQNEFSSQTASIRSSADQATSGDIQISAIQNLTLAGNTSISAESLGDGDAGDIGLESGASIILFDSQLTTVADQADGGNIKLTAPDIIQLTNSQITSSVGGGASTVGGNISVDPEFIILQNSQILANAFAGQGGNIALVATNAVLVDPFSKVDASSALGVSGSVDIQAPIQNLSGTIAPLPEETTPVTTLYGARCTAGQGGNFSTFVNSKAESLSSAPGTFLSSPLLAPSVQASPTTNASNTHQDSVMLTASFAPLVLGQSSESTSVCP